MKDRDRMDALLLMLRTPEVDIYQAESDLTEFGYKSEKGLAVSKRICDALLPGYLFQLNRGDSETKQIQEHAKKVAAVSAALSLYPKCKFIVAALWENMFVGKMLSHYDGDKRMQDVIKMTLTIK